MFGVWGLAGCDSFPLAMAFGSLLVWFGVWFCLVMLCFSLGWLLLVCIRSCFGHLGCYSFR